MATEHMIKCPFEYDSTSDALPAHRLHRAAASFTYEYGDADGAGGTRRLTDDEVHEMLNSAKWLMSNADEALRLAVWVARDHGASWSDIGVGLGMSKQAAQQRFGRTRERKTVGGDKVVYLK